MHHCLPYSANTLADDIDAAQDQPDRTVCVGASTLVARSAAVVLATAREHGAQLLTYDERLARTARQHRKR
jgi:predicted nucleic acid-binding protein